jgi:hypothetical protein
MQGTCLITKEGIFCIPQLFTGWNEEETKTSGIQIVMQLMPVLGDEGGLTWRDAAHDRS